MDRDEFFRRELDELKAAWKADDYVALIKALIFCKENKIPLPEWLGSAIETELIRILGFGGWRSQSGRPGKNEIHAHRWRMVRLWRSGRGWKSPSGAVSATKQEVCEHVSDALLHRPEHCAWTGVRDSYDMVERAIKSGENSQFSISDEEVEMCERLEKDLSG